MIKFSFWVSVAILFTFSCGEMRSQSKNDGKTEVTITLLSAPSASAEEYGVTFTDKNDSLNKLTMAIGKNEAGVLAITLEKMTPTAPLPLDLFQEATVKFGFTVREIIIDSLIKDIYTAKIICSNKTQNIAIKARPIDASTIAMKFNCPIYVRTSLLTR